MREILLNICLTAIALCLFKMLIPEKGLEKQTNFLISCFFLASMVFFFTSGRINFAYDAEIVRESIPFADFDEAYERAQSTAINREMSTFLTKRLEEEDIFPYEIQTFINISDKYRISINEIRLVLNGDEDNEEELEILKRAISITQKEVGESIFVTGEFKS
jgi:hypothetical protein